MRWRWGRGGVWCGGQGQEGTPDHDSQPPPGRHALCSGCTGRKTGLAQRSAQRCPTGRHSCPTCAAQNACRGRTWGAAWGLQQPARANGWCLHGLILAHQRSFAADSWGARAGYQRGLGQEPAANALSPSAMRTSGARRPHLEHCAWQHVVGAVIDQRRLWR
jgi:hypothetical protein